LKSKLATEVVILPLAVASRQRNAMEVAAPSIPSVYKKYETI
jgi:hypothetical protein